LNKNQEELGEDTFEPERFASVKKQIKGLKDVHENYVALKSAVDRKPKVLKQLKEIEAKLSADIKDKKDLEAKIATLGFDERKYEDLQAERNSANTAYQKAVQEFQGKTGELLHLNEKISDLGKQIKRLTAQKAKVVENEEKVVYLSTLEQIMEKFKLNLISRIRPMLSQYGSEFLMKLTQGKYSELELDEDYEIYIFDNGEKHQLKRFSGGEEDIANLSLRLGISRVIAESSGTTGLNMIILDEIFGSQDIHRKRNIISVLNELSNQYQQIFLITHIEEMKEHMGFVIDVFDEPGNEYSEVKVIN
jgi:exonuclease SbcC